MYFIKYIVFLKIRYGLTHIFFFYVTFKMEGGLKMNVNAELVEKISKNGNKYVCIEISLTDKVKKVVFLTDAEVELLKLYLSNSSK